MKILLSVLLITALLNINAQVTISFNADQTEGCAPLSVNFTNTSSGADNYDWTVFNYATGETFSFSTTDLNFSFTDPGDYVVTLNGYDEFYAHLGSYSMNITAKGIRPFWMSSNGQACPDEEIHFNASNWNYSELNWDFGDGTTGDHHDMAHTYNLPGTYTVTLTLNTTCGIETTSQEIEVTNSAIPSVDFSQSGGSEFCYHDEVQFFSHRAATNYFWDFDDGTSSTERNPFHTYIYPGNKVVTLTVTNVCGNSNSKSEYINIRTDIPADATFDIDPNPVCPSTAVTFHPHSLGTYLWSFGTGSVSTQKNPQYIYTAEGMYMVQLNLTNGCGNSASFNTSVTVQPDPFSKPFARAYFMNIQNSDETDTLVLCPGEEFIIENFTEDKNPLTYLWKTGDGSEITEKNLIYSFDEPGIYEITLYATNSCMGVDSAKKWVDIDLSAMPNSQLGTMQDTICPGEAMYFVDFISDVKDNTYSYSIWFGDGESLLDMTEYPDPTMPVFYHIYDEPGVYDYLFTVTNLCGNTLSFDGTIVVTTSDHETFYYANNSTLDDTSRYGCPNDDVEFFIFGGLDYVWYFGDGQTATGPHVLHSYADTGIYNAYVIVTNACDDIDTLYTQATVVSNNYPETWFDISPSNQVCANDTLTFEYHGNANIQSNVDVFWDFGDGNTSDQWETQHAFASGGEYLVKLKVTNGCGSDSTYRVVFVNQPVINFTASNTTISMSESVTFSNLTSGGATYHWDFGDGSTSDDISPTHSWAEQGIYDISLTATSNYGCSGTQTFNDYITVSSLYINTYTYGNVSCYTGRDGFIDIAVTGGYTPLFFEWSDSAQSTTEDISELAAGFYTVTVSDYSGISITHTFEITQPDTLISSLSGTDISCYGNNDGTVSVVLSGGTAPYSYLWSNGSVSSTISDLPAGTYSVSLSDANGCSAETSTEITQPGGIVCSPSAWPATTCGGTDGVATVDVWGAPGPYSYEWNTFPVQTTQTATGLAAGVYTVYVTYGSCIDSATVIINENGGPNFHTQNIYNTPLCPGEANASVTLLANGVEPITYEWSNGLVGSVFYDNIAAGTYIVTATDNNGCMSIASFEVTAFDPIITTVVTSDPLCYGGYTGSAMVYASGGTGSFNYYWSNGSTSNSIIYRPAGVYTVTVTDGYCPVTDEAHLMNPTPMGVLLYKSDVSFYGMADGMISSLVSDGIPSYTYNWSNGDTESTAYGLTAGTYTLTVTDGNGCTATESETINEPDAVESSILASGETTFCYGNTITLDAGSGYLEYQWSTGESTRMITVGETGTYTVTVYESDSYGISSIAVNAVEPYAYQEICLVTVDTASGHNVVAWEKPYRDDIVSFNIYKETTVAYDYDLVATIPYDDLSAYLDEDSDPNVQSYRYKISVVDTCGNESELSDAHKTMHLTVSTGIGVYNLIWENYEGFPFGSYLIYRGTSPSTLTPLAAIASSITTYTDYASVLPYYYQIAVLKEDTCYLTGGSKDISGPYSQSVSNLEDNGIAVNVAQQYLKEHGMLVYPNPSKDFVNIETYNPERKNYQLRLFDVSGKVIIAENSINSEKTVLDLRNLEPGCYFLELSGENKYYEKIIIE